MIKIPRSECAASCTFTSSRHLIGHMPRIRVDVWCSLAHRNLSCSLVLELRARNVALALALDLHHPSFPHSSKVPALACSKSAGACCVGIRTRVWGNGGLSSVFFSASSSSLAFGSLAIPGQYEISIPNRMMAYWMPY